MLELRQIILIEFDEKETKAMKDRIENAEIGYIKDDVPSEKPEENSDETEDEVVENQTEEEKSSTEE